MHIKLLLKNKLSNKEKLFQLSEERFNKETDICYILEKIQEFEKFKIIMLNPEQLKLFNLLAKPLIYLENQKEILKRNTSYKISNAFDLDDTLKHDNKRRLSKLKTYYSKMENETNLSDIDKNLLKLMQNEYI